MQRLQVVSYYDSAHQLLKKVMGTAKGGFDRRSFFQECEGEFDNQFGYQRNIKESFQYLNAVNKGKSTAAGFTKILGDEEMEL